MLTALATIGVLAVALAPAQQSRGGGQAAIAVDVDLVVFHVTVTDSRGRRVTGLSARDFVLSEDDRIQSIRLFSAEDVPASVGLLVDNSGSMIGKHTEVTNAALAFAGASHPDDELFVVNFNEKPVLGLPSSTRFTNDPAQLRAALFSVPPGLTALYDALALGLEHLDEGTRGRKALVVLSDGGDNASRLGLNDVLHSARRSSATIYSVGFYDDTNRDRNPRALRQMAASTGGRAYFPQSLDDLQQVWLDIAGAIRGQYTIGYHSSNQARDGGFRKVGITAARAGRGALRITARDGYHAPAGSRTAK